jgi:hypothetical protein
MAAAGRQLTQTTSVDRPDDRAAVVGRMQRHRQRHRAFRQPIDVEHYPLATVTRRRDRRRRSSSMMRNAVTIVEVGQRLAHAHHHDVADAVAGNLSARVAAQCRLAYSWRRSPT